MTGTNEKLRALFLSTLMILSVVGGTVALAGTAAAAANAAGNASPDTPSSTSTHTFSAEVDADEGESPLNSIEVDYSVDGNFNGDISNVDQSDIVGVGIDTNDDGTIDTDTSGDLSGVSSSNGETLTVGFGGEYTPTQGDDVIVEFNDAINPTSAGTYDVDVGLNVQSNDNPFTTTLDINGQAVTATDATTVSDDVTVTVNTANGETVTVENIVNGDTTETVEATDGDDDGTVEVTLAAGKTSGGSSEALVTYSDGDTASDTYTTDNYLVEVNPSNVTWGASETLEGAIYDAPGSLADSQQIDYSLYFVDTDGNTEVASSDTSNGEFIITTSFDIEDNNYLKDFPADDGDGPAYTVLVNDTVGTEATPSNDDGSTVVDTRLDVTAEADPSEITYGESADVSGTVADTDGGLADYAVALRDPSLSAVKSSTTNNAGEYGFTAAFTDAGQWEVVTNEGGTIAYEPVTVGPQEADVSIEAAGENLANFEEDYTINVTDSETGDNIDTSAGSITGYVNVTGPFDEDLSGENYVLDSKTKDTDGDEQLETVWFHTDSAIDGTETTFSATPLGASVDVTLENTNADGLEVTDDAANTPESPDYVGSDSAAVNGAEPVNVIGFQVQDPQDENPADAGDETLDYSDISEDAGPNAAEVLPLSDSDNGRIVEDIRLGDDANQNFEGMTQYRLGFQLTDEDNENIQPSDLNEISISGAGIDGSVVDNDGVATQGTNVVDAVYNNGQYYVLVRPTEVTSADEQIEVTVDVPDEEPVTETINTSGLHVEQFNVDDESNVEAVPGSSTIDVAAVIEDATNGDDPINNGRVRVSQNNEQIAQIDARTQNVNDGEYTFDGVEVGPRGIDGDGDGIGEDISQLTFTAYQYADANENQALEQTEVTKATVQTLGIELQENLNITYDAANTSNYAGADNGTFTLTRGVEYDQIAFDLSDDEGAVDLTAGIDGTDVGLNDIAHNAGADEKLVTLTTTDDNGDMVELDVRFDTDASNPSEGYYVITDIEENGDTNVSSTGALGADDSFVFDGSLDAAVQSFTLNVETPDRSQATGDETGTFAVDNAQIETEIVGVAGTNVPNSTTDLDGLGHNQNDEFNYNVSDIETPTIGIDRVYRINGTATDALGTPLNGSAVTEVYVTKTGLTDNADNAEIDMVSGPGVSNTAGDDVQIDNENGTFQFDLEGISGDDDGLLTPTFEVEAQEDVSAAPQGVTAITGSPTAQNPLVEVYDENGADLPNNPSVDSDNGVLAQDNTNNLRIEAFPADAAGFVLPDDIRYGITGPYAENDVEGTTTLSDSIVTDEYDEGQLVFLSVTPTSTGNGLLQLRSDSVAPTGDVTTDDPITKNVSGANIAFDVLQSNLQVDIGLSESTVESGDTVTVLLTRESTGAALPQDVAVSLVNPDGTVTLQETTNASGQTTLQVPAGASSGTWTVETRPAGYAPGSTDLEVLTPAAIDATGFDVSNTTLKVGDELTVDATVENTGDAAGSEEITLYVNGEPVANETVSVAGGATETVTFTQNFSTAGTYDVSVESLEAATITVEERESFFEVSGLDAPETVTRGDNVTVSATITNTGGQQATQTAAFQFDGETVVSENVSLNSSESTTVEFTVPVDAEPGTYTHGISTADDSQTAQLTVEPRPSTFDVSNFEAPETVTQGDDITISATVTNTGGEAAQKAVSLTVDGSTVTTDNITLLADSSEDVTFDVSTAERSPGYYTVGIETPDDSAQQNVTVEAPAAFEVSDLSPMDVTVTQGDVINVSATVENTGDVEDTQMVEFRVAGDTLASENVSLAGGANTTVEFTGINTSALAAGNYTHGVYTDDASQTATLTVEEPAEPANFAVSELSPMNVTVTQGDVINVSATVTNTGEIEDTQMVEFRVAGDTLASENVSLAGGANTTVEFTGINTSALAAGNYTHGVYTDDASQTATLTVENATDEIPDDAVYAPGSAAAEYDSNADGQIDIGELGSAAEAFSSGELDIGQLGSVAEAFSAS